MKLRRNEYLSAGLHQIFCRRARTNLDFGDPTGGPSTTRHALQPRWPELAATRETTHMMPYELNECLHQTTCAVRRANSVIQDTRRAHSVR